MNALMNQVSGKTMVFGVIVVLLSVAGAISGQLETGLIAGLGLGGVAFIAIPDC